MNTEKQIEKLRTIQELQLQEEGDNRWSVFCEVPMTNFDWLSFLEGLDLRSLTLRTTHLQERRAQTYLPKIRSIQSLNLSGNWGLDGVFLLVFPDDYPIEVMDVTETHMRDLALEQFIRFKKMKRVIANEGQFAKTALATIPNHRA